MTSGHMHTIIIYVHMPIHKKTREVISMPRSIKCRRVCQIPENRLFLPQRQGAGRVTLTMEQLEALRLCDLENLDQDVAAKRMDVSRGTLQRILYAARRITAQALVEGLGIEISGGNYQVTERCCAKGMPCQTCKMARGVMKQSEENTKEIENHE